MTEEVRKYLALQKRLNARSPLKKGVRVLPVTKTVEPARILPLRTRARPKSAKTGCRRRWKSCRY